MPQGQEWRDEGLDQEGDSWGDAPEGQRGLLRSVPPPTSRSAARAEGFGSDRAWIPGSSTPQPGRRAGLLDMSQANSTAAQWEPTFEPSTAAQVLALNGKWAKLWFPESDETLWVDLTQVEYEPVVARQTPPSKLA
jgi:hypothetical protein